MSRFDTLSTAERVIINFERFGIPGVYRLGRYTYKHAHESLPAHAHEGMIEICYCEKGQQVYEVNGERYHIRGGDVFITFPGELHSTAQHPEEKGILYWLILKVDDQAGFLDCPPPDAAAFRDRLLSLPGRHFKGGAVLKKWLDPLFGWANATAHPLMRVQVLHQLTGFLLAVVQRSTTSAALQPSDRRTRMHAYIAGHLCEDLSVERLAASMHFSASHFKGWFRKEFGMTPADYMLRLRIDEAKKMLQGPAHLSIGDTACRLNFSSSQYFATVFRKYTGITPTEYKQHVVAVQAREFVLNQD